MKSLNNDNDKNELMIRLANLDQETNRLWGKMTSHQMICHLTDSFKCVIGEKAVSNVDTVASRTLVKWIALRTPIKWPQGTPTRPEVSQEIGGTKPVEFRSDVQQLKEMIERFARKKVDFDSAFHPFFGKMSQSDWLRWGYRHVDHHLRQFGL